MIDETHPLIVYFEKSRENELFAICDARIRMWWNEGDKTAFMYQVQDSHYVAILEGLKAAAFEYRAWDVNPLEPI